MIKALKMKYEAEIQTALTALHIIMNHPTAVAEHPTGKLLEDADQCVQIIADAEDKIEVLKRYEDEIYKETYH